MECNIDSELRNSPKNLIESENLEKNIKQNVQNLQLPNDHTECKEAPEADLTENPVNISIDAISALDPDKPDPCSHPPNILDDPELNIIPKQSDEGINQTSQLHSDDIPKAIDQSTPNKINESDSIKNECNVVREELQQYKDICEDFKIQLEQFKLDVQHKDDFIKLIEREKLILEKEKYILRTQVDSAIKDKENIVIRFATKEKKLLDAKKEKELIEKQLIETKREVKNLTTKYQNLNEEKSRISYVMEERCMEIKKQKNEIDKYKQDITNLETKLKWNSVKLNEEIESKLAMEKRLEEEGPNKVDEKETEKKRMEYEASMILLKHEIDSKERQLENLKKDYKLTAEKSSNLQEQLNKEIEQNNVILHEMEILKSEHSNVQNQLSHELLNSAKLRGQLEELCLLKTQHTINEEKILELTKTIEDLELKISIFDEDINQLRLKNNELLSINKELTEFTVDLQNQLLLQTSKTKAIEAELEIHKKEKSGYNSKYNELNATLKNEIDKRNEERVLLSKHLSEKTKSYEVTKQKLENALGDLEAVKKKHSQVFKELNREIQKYKKSCSENLSEQQGSSTSNCKESHSSNEDLLNQPNESYSHQSSGCESDGPMTLPVNHQCLQEPSTQHLVNRILRLQQAAARQTEKIDFLENHTMTLVSELQKKSKLIQYYMMRDQTGALTSSKMDQNKTELAKYGGVMSAIYSGIKGSSSNSSPTSMTLELSLEINKKLQAVLEDTLLKNITLKENLDVMGLEIDKLTKQLAQQFRS